MTERSSPLDALMDLLVYAPVGLVLVAAEEMPKLAARGRAQLGGQLSMARMVGQFAVAQGRQQVAKRSRAAAGAGRPARRPGPAWTASGAATASRPAGSPQHTGRLSPDDTLADRTGAPASEWSGPEQSTGPTATVPAPAEAGPDVVGGKAAPPAEPVPTQQSLPDTGPGPLRPASDAARAASDAARPGPVPDQSGLAIPGYDSLAASQVVPRLAGLSPDELAAVEAYESAHRARRTILTRVRQLQER